MSPRYYLVSAIIVAVLTIFFSWWKQKKTAKEILIIFCQVVVLWVFLLAVVFGLAELLKYLGIANSGFIIEQEIIK